MRNIALATALLSCLADVPATAMEPTVDPGEKVESRVDGDLDGDSKADLAYIVGTDDWRELRVVLSRSGETETLDLGITLIGSGSLSIMGKVLAVEDLTGGTTAIFSIRRFRYNALHKRMQLIGLDASFYSRTYAHDGFEASWNLLNGNAVTRKLRLNLSGEDATYDKIRERRLKRRISPQWLAEAPDPATVLKEMRQD